MAISITRPRSRAFMERQVTFQCHDAQMILRGFGKLAFSMYQLGISLRFFLPDERVDSLSDTVYEELIQPLADEIAAELKRVEVLCKENKIKPLEKYSHPVNRTIRIFYPQVNKIVDLTQSLDTLVCRLNDLWFAGKIKDRDYLNTKEKYSKTLLETARRIKSLATTTMAEAKKAQEEQQGVAKKETEGQTDGDTAPLRKVAVASS